MLKKKLSELITIEEIRNWGEGDIVTVSAGTGVGKSYFVKNILSAFAKKDNKKILMLIHRNSCVKQFQEEIKRDNKSDVIEIMSYQKLEYDLGHKLEVDLSQYQYIVSDEAHYFFSDSSFSYKTEISLDALLAMNNSVKIFMTATGNNMYSYLTKEKGLAVREYDIPIQYDFINTLKFFSKWSTVENKLDEVIKANKKALVFCHSAKEAYILHCKYHKNSLFNCSKHNKDYYGYVDNDKIDKMLLEEKFEENILFTTACMDAGVNLWDNDLGLIVLDIGDIDVLKQCLGRKRLKDGEKIDVLIKNLANDKLGGRKRKAISKIDKADFFKTHTEEEYLAEYPRESDVSNMVYYDGDTLKVNEIMYYKHKRDIEIITDMIDESYSYYISRSFQREENIEIIEEQAVKDKKERTLIEYLDSIVGERILTTDKEKVEDIIQVIDYRFNSKQMRTAKKLNEGMNMNNIPFNIKQGKSGSNRYWIIEKVTR